MVHIKRLVMYGFKSFPLKTEIPFTPEINVILGPNGSGKSNISDAICFVLGRLSAKSMRAAKAKNLIFIGTKVASPAREAMVEMIFDNSDGTFSLEEKEISIKRIVKRNGQSIYKINNQTKTRQEVIALLAQAGIDPNGFNIILQGEIQNFVRMHTEERRKIVEEVSGISIYESRKEKSLKELNKTEDRLKEVGTILRERTAYLNNLEKERQQALRFKKLEGDVKRFKASIISSNIYSNKKDEKKISENIEKKNKEIDKLKKQIISFETEISNLEAKIISINSTIQESTGLEQEKLNQEITNFRAEIAGMTVNLENYNEKLSKIEIQKVDLNQTIREDESTLRELDVPRRGSTKNKQLKQKEVDAKKDELEKVEDERKKFYMIKSELKSIRERLNEKQISLQNSESESNFLLKQIKSLARELFDKGTSLEVISKLKISFAEKRQLLEDLRKREIELEKVSYRKEYEIDEQNKLMDKISKMDICPVCKNKITKEHRHSIGDEVRPKIASLQKEIGNSDHELGEINNKNKLLEQGIEQISQEISKREADLIKISNIREKEQQMRSLHVKNTEIKAEILEFSKRKESLDRKFDKSSTIEQRYETLRIEVQEISLRNEENVDSEISFKKRELERAKISLKQLGREEEDLKEESSKIQKNLELRQKLLLQKRVQEEDLSKKFQGMILERDKLQKEIREREMSLSSQRNIIHNIEQESNSLRINKARVDAIIENLGTELLEFEGVEIIKANRESLSQRLEKTQDILSRIGTVNLRSLEVYDSVKQEYDLVKDKVEIIVKEKEGILKIIHLIDIKKKKAFLKTLEELNEIFSRNFAQISTKGQVSLELDNRKDPFEGGVNIIVKVGHGKYFDVTSLSGGEQTMVALSLIFAIQELSPYCFYVLDEIDAALDKRNSERLANLLNKYMKKGQYIVITHNDEIITKASNLYGVSMHDGISKIVSLRV